MGELVLDLFHNPQKLWVQIILAKYPGSDISQVLNHSRSDTTRSGYKWIKRNMDVDGDSWL